MSGRLENWIWAGILGVMLLSGCGKQVPKGIIHRDKMERILYDYHLGMSLSVGPGNSANYQKEMYKQYVFAKHGVTEAEFDSSMVWYTRHTDELAAIYKRLGTRFRGEKKQVQAMLALRGSRPSVSLPGDTVDLWYDHKLFWLTDAPLTGKVVFEVLADSNFKERDAFCWSADYVFLSERKQKAVMGFNVIFENDSVMGKVENISRSGTCELCIRSDSAFAIRSVNGFIYYQDTDSVKTTSPGVLVNRLALMRYHVPVDTTFVAENVPVTDEEVRTDSVSIYEAADSVSETSSEENVPSRLNPREMKENRSRGNNARPKQIQPKN